MENKRLRNILMLFVFVVALLCGAGTSLLFLNQPKPMPESLVPEGVIPMDAMELGEVVNATSSNVTGQAKMTDEARMLNSLGFSTTQGHPISIK